MCLKKKNEKTEKIQKDINGNNSRVLYLLFTTNQYQVIKTTGRKTDISFENNARKKAAEWSKKNNLFFVEL